MLEQDVNLSLHMQKIIGSIMHFLLDFLVLLCYYFFIRLI
jgi:hypothetical protein